jgi:hypothetical protein
LRAARHAVELDPTCQMGWESLADAAWVARDFGAFRSAAERAMALNHRNTKTIAPIAVLLGMTGEVERAADLARRATALNPHHPGWYNCPIFMDLYSKGPRGHRLPAR